MKISVVTVCYNSADTIRDTMVSIREQSYPHYEHIIVDGLSKDKTLAIVDGYKTDKTRIFSGKDAGLYDAMNKGIELATGDIIAFLNSDDFYSSCHVLEHVATAWAEQCPLLLYGDIVYVKRDDAHSITRVWNSGAFRPGRINFGWHPPHPAFFASRQLLKDQRGFRLQFPISADYDLMIRCLITAGHRIAYIPEIFVNMREGGASNKSLGTVLRSNREVYNCLKQLGYRQAALTAILKPLSKLFQFSLFQPKAFKLLSQTGSEG